MSKDRAGGIEAVPDVADAPGTSDHFARLGNSRAGGGAIACKGEDRQSQPRR